MHGTLKVLAHLIQEFQPIAPFYTSILMEKKQFAIEEISNFILPFYFYSSFITLTMCFLIIGILGYLKSLLVILCFQIIMLLLIALMRPRKIHLAQIVYSIGGATNVYKSVLRTLLITAKSSVEAQLGIIKTLRYVMLSLAAWIGQGIYNQTNNYNIIIALSILSTTIAGIISIFLTDKDTNISTRSILKTVSSHKAFMEAIESIFHKKLIIGLLCGSSSSLLQIYLGIFAQTIFHEKAKNQQTPSIAVLFFYRLIDTPIYGLSYLIVLLFSFISPIFAPNPHCDRHNASLKSGYIEGTTRIMASTLSAIIIELIPNNIRSTVLLFMFSLAILFFILLNSTSSIGYAQVLYFLTLTCVICSETLGKSSIYRTSNRVFVSNLCIFIESLIHTLVNYICRIKHFKGKTKGVIYGSLAFIGLVMALSITLFG